ncbi:MAG: ABC transporter substrate-binding protein [Gammaproteobacteria bacterium]
MNKKMIAIAVATAALTAWSGVSAQAPVKVGALMGVTGPLANFIPPIRNAAMLAVEQVNEQGGLLDGRPMELIVADTQAAAQPAVDAANKLVGAENVVALYGALSSGATMASASAVSVANGVLQISPTSTTPELTDLEDNDYVFRVLPADDYQGRVLAKIVREEGIDKVAITYVNNDYGVGIGNAFKNEFEKAGGTVTGFQVHEEKKNSYRSELATLAGGGAQALVLIAYAGDSGIKIVRQSLENGFFEKFIGTDGLRDNLLLEEIGIDNVKGSIFSSPTSPPDSEAGAKFEAAYTARHGPTKDQFFIQQSYDAAFLIALAIEQAGSTDRTAIRDALRKVANSPGAKVMPGEWDKAKSLIAAGQDIDYEGVAGPHDFDENGDVTGFIGKFVIDDEGYEEVGIFQ